MISVIIPTYNRARAIERSVRSVLNQTYSDIELIIVDDCSTDNTKLIVDSIHDTRLKYVRLNKNSGACVARNKGIELAKGDYIAFQDSDDEWYLNKLEKQLAALVENNADVCFCQIKRYLTNGEKYYIFPTTPKKTGVVPYSVLYENSKVGTQTILCRRKVVEKYKFDINVIKGQDYDWTMQAGYEYSFYYLAEPLVNQYFQPDSITLNKKRIQADRDMACYFLKKYSSRYQEDAYMEYCMIKKLAYWKCLSGEKAGDDYRIVFNRSGKMRFLIAGALDDIGVLHWLLKLRSYFKLGRKTR